MLHLSTSTYLLCLRKKLCRSWCFLNSLACLCNSPSDKVLVWLGIAPYVYTACSISCKHMTEMNMGGWFTVQSVWPHLFTDHDCPIKYKPVAHEYHYCFKVFTLKLPYSGKLSREKTLANWWKISLLQIKPSLISRFCRAKECYAPRFCGKNYRE